MVLSHMESFCALGVSKDDLLAREGEGDTSAKGDSLCLRSVEEGAKFHELLLDPKSAVGRRKS